MALFLWATSAVVFYLSVVCVPTALVPGQAGAPWPDGAEYLDMAVHRAHGEGFGIHLAGDLHPARYPPGYPSLLTLALSAGVEPAFAAHRVNAFSGALLVLLVAGAAWRMGGAVAAGLASLLLVTLPAFVILCRSPMSEVASTLVVAVAACLLVSFSTLSRPRRAGGKSNDWSAAKLWLGVLGALLLSLSLTLRTSNALFLPLIPAALATKRLAANSPRDSRLFLEAVLLSLGGLIGLLPLLLYNFSYFESPLATGYSYWVSEAGDGSSFHLRHLLPNLEYYAREFLQAEAQFTTANLYGNGSYFGPAFALLLLGLLTRSSEARRLWLFVTAGVVYGVAILLYFFTDARLLFPVLVLALPLAASGLVEMVSQERRPNDSAHQPTWRVTLPIVGLLCLTLAVLGWPSRSGGFELNGMLFDDGTRSSSVGEQLIEQFLRLEEPSPQLILTDLPPPVLHARKPEVAAVAPLIDLHLYRWNPAVFSFDGRSRARLVASSLSEGVSVWALLASREVLEIDSLAPPPAGYDWEIVSRYDPVGGIARLVREH